MNEIGNSSFDSPRSDVHVEECPGYDCYEICDKSSVVYHETIHIFWLFSYGNKFYRIKNIVWFLSPTPRARGRLEYVIERHGVKPDRHGFVL